MMHRLAVAVLIVGSLTISTPWRWVMVGVLVVVAVVEARRADGGAAVIAWLGVIIVGTASRNTTSIWIAAAILGLAWWLFPSLRSHVGPIRVGQIDGLATVVAIATVVAAAAALAIWAGAQPPSGLDADESNLERLIDQVSGIPVWLFPFAAMAFALINSVAEELVYRGVLFHCLTPLGTGMALISQAAAFGAIHLNGFPSGWVGVMMATVYGLALGWLRVRTGGLLLPVGVHFAADLVIAALVRFTMG